MDELFEWMVVWTLAFLLFIVLFAAWDDWRTRL